MPMNAKNLIQEYVALYKIMNVDSNLQDIV